MDDIRSLIEKIRAQLKERYGSKVLQIILYGSFARGKATFESDVDLLVVVDDSLDPWEVRRSLDDLLLDILLANSRLVSVLVVPKSFYESYRSPFLKQVQKEGIPL
jgi:predicted nucleotidyltransferase